MSIILVALMLSGWPVAIDGDTIVLDGKHIRIANIDAPEIERYKCDAELRLGLVAKKRMAELLDSGPVTVHEGDPASGRLIVRYGRKLATVAA